MTIRDILLSAGGSEVPIVRSDYFRDVTPGSGKTKTPPVGAVYMRVAVIGAGSYGTLSEAGGCGGGCAATKIVPASTITYTIGAAATSFNQDAGNSTASFAGYSLTGGGGKSASTPAGGIGTGGDYNYSGGLGVKASTSNFVGGGAAGPFGNGGTYGVNGGDGNVGAAGWGVGGGGAGATSNAGGGGTGASGGSSSGTTNTTMGGNPAAVWGLQGSKAATGTAPANAGAMGGGAGGGTGGAGAGGLVVEYFYTS